MPKLKNSEADIYLIDLSQINYTSKFNSILSDDERLRAEKRNSVIQRERFIKQKAITRYLLSIYLETPPQALSFNYTQNKKPTIPGPFTFNISHSDDYLLFGITKDADIGVDIEKHKNIEIERIAKRFFTKNEINSILKEEKEKQKDVFFEIWTAKEAYVKALGTGIFHDLPSFCTIEKDWEHAKDWTLRHLKSPEHTHICVAINKMKKINLMYNFKIADII
jgi:4'-phosphopantetheinyl transferase